MTSDLMTAAQQRDRAWSRVLRFADCGWARYCGSCAYDFNLPDPVSPQSLGRVVSAWCPVCGRWREGQVILMPMWELVGRVRAPDDRRGRLAMHYVHYLDPDLMFVVSEMP